MRALLLVNMGVKLAIARRARRHKRRRGRVDRVPAPQAERVGLLALEAADAGFALLGVCVRGDERFLVCRDGRELGR